MISNRAQRKGCKDCQTPLDFEFSFAFQPIVNVREKSIFGYEALVRGIAGESAYSVLSRVNDENRYAFDQTCRVKAITLASHLGLDKVLSINFLPNAVYEPEHCIQSTLQAATETGFPINKLMFEITESEVVLDPAHLRNIFEHYEKQGFITAIDDFGAGHAGFNMLANFIPQILKIDMELVRNIDTNSVKQVLVKGLIDICQQLSITVLAEGIETDAEMLYFKSLNVELMQGYYFAKPGFQCLPDVQFS
ncbi:EAL domain-containing protein [Nitrincola nitratireducens]|uniref:Blue light-and temperature-regulated antirepressor YcgF n=1 Tax=Nitrincola nitratireducens TaxID=1229521 RepID=W9UUE5_9GAMM|nr:EAL domain-containing protein [Nitrincola nitratireducens]EXJ10843.1 Blue light- and temperature-regulated antirepressor YcgF [Nitrincola nitratireducens]